jgi:hypothetical protein
MTALNKQEIFPRLANHKKPIRTSRQVISLGLFGYLMLLFVLAEENVLPPPSFGTLLSVAILLSVTATVAAMVWIFSNGLQGLMYRPQREYRSVLDELPEDSLKKMASHYPEFTETERGVLRHVLNRRCPGWSETVSGDIRSALS